MSAWRDFTMMPTLRHKAFLNIAGASHLQPIFSHPEIPFVAAFSQYHALGNATAGAIIYGNGTGSLAARAATGGFVAATGGRNNGGAAGEVGFVACGGGGGGGSMPGRLAKYCT